MSAEIDLPPELFSLLDRLAAIGRKLREQGAEHKGSDHVLPEHDTKPTITTPEMDDE